jgi:putative ABC transport system substrate-binding protein
LHELGYVEGKKIVIEYRYAEGKLDRLPALAAELVRLKVDVIVTAGPPATRAAKAAATTIPIVMAQDSDPVGNGALLPALHDLAGTLLDYQPFPQS